ncbi:MAG: preprotein translocase, SecE subunit [Clostridiales bacterium]|jgi:preprotein translocase subunit SecE|nr:preprotein translocase, SecE subunit [Clostridiales bacterium]
MADEVKVSKWKNTQKGISKFFREIRSELNRVIWPTRDQLVNNTLTVLLACLVIGVIIWVADVAFGFAFRSFLRR